MTPTEKHELIDNHNRIIDAIQKCHQNIKVDLSTPKDLFSGMAIYNELAKQALKIAHIVNDEAGQLVKVDMQGGRLIYQ